MSSLICVISTTWQDVTGGIILVSGAVTGIWGVVALLHRISKKIDDVLEGTQTATQANQKAEDIKVLLNTLQATVESLAQTTTDTFAARTKDFTEIAIAAEARVKELERELAELKVEVASVKGAGDELKAKFAHIEEQLATIQDKLVTLMSGTPAPAVPATEIGG